MYIHVYARAQSNLPNQTLYYGVAYNANAAPPDIYIYNYMNFTSHNMHTRFKSNRLISEMATCGYISYTLKYSIIMC